MRLVLLISLAMSAAAQDPPAPELVTGSVDAGYRWRTDIAGSLNTYRSVVNLGEGMRLFGTDLVIENPSKRFFDRLTLGGIGWGGDPYTTARLRIEKQRIYRFSFDYRNIAYFNALPSFANPFADRGIFLDQQSFDTRRRMADFELELRPGSRIVPYLRYTRDSDHGTGVTDFVSDANEYPVASLVRNHTDQYRGGVRFEMDRLHVTLEQGAAIFKDDEEVRNATRNNGNLASPLLGQTLFLGSLLQAYGVRGSSPYTKAVFTASPVSWFNAYGQFTFSEGQTDVHYTQTDTGQFVVLSSLLFYNSEMAVLNGAAKQPRASASAGFEIRPLRRVRMIENWTTDRLHTDSTNASARFVDNYNQNSLDVFFDLTSKITLRGGHRYVWGDTTVPKFFGAGLESGELRRNSGVAGISFRPFQKLSANFDFEGGSADSAYYRTSLRNYTRYRARARYQPFPTLSLTFNISALNNDNPIPSVQYKFSSRDYGMSVQWTPLKRITLLGDYSRTSVRSDILYLIPQTLAQAQSIYREDAHQATGLVDLKLPAILSRTAQIAAGGSLFYGTGSRPTRFYQPLAKLTLPVAKNIQWISEWRWYGFSEPFYAYEAFRTTLFSTGLRMTR